ncbi:MAG: metabolite traffic protein EboE, partial [Planctomycetaceae bacterium]
MAALPSLLGYCTNVHAGTNVDHVLSNLRACALPVRESMNADSLGIGLWFSEDAAVEALRVGPLQRIRERLHEMALIPYTFNGFPQGDFHSAIVKHRVYQPTWWEPARAEYTRNLIQLIDQLLPLGMNGSISTLPIAWGSPSPTEDQLTQSAKHLAEIAIELNRLFEATGRHIVIAIEPEPGCALTDTASLRGFFDDFFSAPRIAESTASIVRKHITMCHDICHAAVMAEDQAHELRSNHEHGIRTAKVQVSSAISVDWEQLNPEERAQAVHQLSQFAEDRYLHQTMVISPDGVKHLHEDLPVVLKDPALRRGQWRIHFHVPIYLQGWGHLQT